MAKFTTDQLKRQDGYSHRGNPNGKVLRRQPTNLIRRPNRRIPHHPPARDESLIGEAARHATLRQGRMPEDAAQYDPAKQRRKAKVKPKQPDPKNNVDLSQELNIDPVTWKPPHANKPARPKPLKKPQQQQQQRGPRTSPKPKPRRRPISQPKSTKDSGKLKIPIVPIIIGLVICGGLLQTCVKNCAWLFDDTTETTSELKTGERDRARGRQATNKQAQTVRKLAAQVEQIVRGKSFSQRELKQLKQIDTQLQNMSETSLDLKDQLARNTALLYCRLFDPSNPSYQTELQTFIAKAEKHERAAHQSSNDIQTRLGGELSRVQRTLVNHDHLKKAAVVAVVIAAKYPESRHTRAMLSRTYQALAKADQWDLILDVAKALQQNVPAEQRNEITSYFTLQATSAAIRQKQYNVAADLNDILEKTTPKKTYAYSNYSTLARAAESQKKTDQAIELYTKAYQTVPDDKYTSARQQTLAYQLMVLCKSAGPAHRDQTIQWANTLIKIDPDHSKARYAKSILTKLQANPDKTDASIVTTTPARIPTRQPAGHSQPVLKPTPLSETFGVPDYIADNGKDAYFKRYLQSYYAKLLQGGIDLNQEGDKLCINQVGKGVWYFATGYQILAPNAQSPLLQRTKIHKINYRDNVKNQSTIYAVEALNLNRQKMLHRPYRILKDYPVGAYTKREVTIEIEFGVGTIEGKSRASYWPAGTNSVLRSVQSYQSKPGLYDKVKFTRSVKLVFKFEFDRNKVIRTSLPPQFKKSD